MTTEFCPRCSEPRTGAFRYCRRCQFDFDAQPLVDAASRSDPIAGPGPASSAPDHTRTSVLVAGLAWLIAAALTGYIGLTQLAYVRTIFDSGDLQATAFWNLIAGAVTLYFSLRLLTGASRSSLT